MLRIRLKVEKNCHHPGRQSLPAHLPLVERLIAHGAVQSVSRHRSVDLAWLDCLFLQTFAVSHLHSPTQWEYRFPKLSQS